VQSIFALDEVDEGEDQESFLEEAGDRVTSHSAANSVVLGGFSHFLTSSANGNNSGVGLSGAEILLGNAGISLSRC